MQVETGNATGILRPGNGRQNGAGARAAVLRRASCRLSAGLASRTIRAHMSDPTPEPPETDKPKPPSSPEEVTRKLEDFIKNTLGGQVLFTRVEGPWRTTGEGRR
jgi:hypothetical protein